MTALAFTTALALLLSACGAEQPERLALDSAPGSAQPHLAEGPRGEIVLSYLEPAAAGVALRFAVLQGDGWSSPSTVAEGSDWLVNWADFPSVVPLGDGVLAAHWLRRVGDGFAYDALVAVSDDAGSSWSEPIKLNRDGTLTEHGFVSLYPAARGVGAVWLDGRDLSRPQPDTFVGTQLRGATVADAALHDEHVIDPVVCDCCQTDLALSSRGPVAAYRNRTEAEIRDIYFTRLIDGSWTEGRVVAADGWHITGCPVNGPAVAAQGDKVAIAWFTKAPENRVRVALSADAGASFDVVVDVAEQPLGRVDVAFRGNGDAVVSWLERGGRLIARRLESSGALGPPMEVALMETHRDAGFPQMVAAGERLIFAWTDTATDRSRVRSAALRL